MSYLHPLGTLSVPDLIELIVILVLIGGSQLKNPLLLTAQTACADTGAGLY